MERKCGLSHKFLSNIGNSGELRQKVADSIVGDGIILVTLDRIRTLEVNNTRNGHDEYVVTCTDTETGSTVILRIGNGDEAAQADIITFKREERL